eukprot:scaffold18506_cov51-Isochrysis_galbana.AAC.1
MRFGGAVGLAQPTCSGPRQCEWGLAGVNGVDLCGWQSPPSTLKRHRAGPAPFACPSRPLKSPATASINPTPDHLNIP